MPWSHQTFRPVPAVKILEIMLRNRCWPTTFCTITTEDVDGWCVNWLVWSTPQCPMRSELLGKSNHITPFNLWPSTFNFWFEPWDCWGLDSGPPLFTLLQPEMPTDGVWIGWCDQPLSVPWEVSYLGKVTIQHPSTFSLLPLTSGSSREIVEDYVEK